MTLCFDGKRKAFFQSNRVKCVDIHPDEPWILATLHDGRVHIYNYDTEQSVKTFEVCGMPIRAGKFVARKNWIIIASDDQFIRVYDYNTSEQIHQFVAHDDFIRSIIVHPTQSYLLSASDDMTIKLWDWDAQWTLKQTFQGHTHYVMHIAINPKDDQTFASASLDSTIKIWHLDSAEATLTLEGHVKGVNCVHYCSDNDKPYLISGSDDHQIKIWNSETKMCIQTLDGHSDNVDCALFHPNLPLIMSGSEDGTVKLWNLESYHLESTLNYDVGRCWSMSCSKSLNYVALGYDQGTLIIQVDQEKRNMSTDHVPADKIVD